MTTNKSSAAPFPVPTFNGSGTDASLDRFLDFLRTLISQYLSDNAPRIPSSNKDAWITVINGLTEHLLSTFPLPNVVSWDALREKVTSITTTLEVVRKVFERVDGIHEGTSETIKKLFARLFSLCCVLNFWVDAEVLPEEGLVDPRGLREGCFDLLVVVLRGLGGNVLVGGDNTEPSWKTLREIMHECLEACHELMSKSLHSSYPLTISLFSTPRISDTKPDDLFEVATTNPFDIVISSPAYLPTYLGNFLQVLVHVTVPSLLAQWFIADIFGKVIGTMRELLSLSLSQAFPIPLIRRSKTCELILACSLHLTLAPARADQSSFFASYLVRYRLYEGPKDVWEAFDNTAAHMLEGRSIQGVSKIDLIDIIKSLCSETWGPQGSKLRNLGYTFLRGALTDFEPKNMESLLQDLVPFNETLHFPAILEIFRSTSIKSPPPENTLGRPSLHHLRLILEDLGYDCSERIDQDHEWDQEYIQRALNEIIGLFNRPLRDPSEAARLRVAMNLRKLPCLVAGCDTSDCRMHNGSRKILFAQMYHSIATQLLKGTGLEVTATVRREVFRAIRYAINHHAAAISMYGMDQTGELLVQYITDLNRTVRLSACYGLSALILSYFDMEASPWHSTQKIFTSLYKHMTNAKESMKETVLVAVGLMGKTKHPEVLGQVVCFLIAQLGQRNPVMKGMARIQLVEVANFHNKAPYTLIQPYLDHIASFVISRVSSLPNLLVETCKLMSIAPADFITMTASRTLPKLFADCDTKTVETVSRGVNQKPSTLFLNHSPEILASILTLPKHAEAKATSFVLKILADASQSESISLQMIVRLSLVKLLSELVILMGDENPEIVNSAVEAMGKVERIVNGNVKTGPNVDLSGFLKAQMLGIISHVNDVLQDVQGKKTTAAKRKILRGLGALILRIGPSITYVAPQVMATFQTMVSIPELSEVTLQSWYNFLTTLKPSEVGPLVGPTSAALVGSWKTFSRTAKKSAIDSMEYIVRIVGEDIREYLDDIVDISSIPELSHIHNDIQVLRGEWEPRERLQRLLERATSENVSVAIQSLGELRTFLLEETRGLVPELIRGAMFDPIIGRLVSTLFTAACRDGDGIEPLKLLAYECIGILGAIDPDRCELPGGQSRIIVKNNFTDEDESMQFALHLICDLLVGAFRSTSDIKHQSFLAYAIQELLKFCQFKPALVGAGTGTSVSNRVRNRWKSLPKHILETVTPLLEGKFTLNIGSAPDIKQPIYQHQPTYREWIQLWTVHLIDKASGKTAKTVFSVFRSAARNKDAGVAHHLLPHLVLNILIGGNEEDAQEIRTELIVVLEDQINPESKSSPDKKLLSTQAVFMLLDHLNAWVRVVRQDLNAKKADSKRARGDRNLLNTQLEEQLMRVDSILSSIDRHLMAQAAFQCKAFARSLMNFEQHTLSLKATSPQVQDLSDHFERLHEIYAHLDEPDGMEGVSTLILSPSLEHQIRQHESTGRWSSAQSCWEVCLQQSPDNVEYHQGLLRCLRNLGHYDTLRTHVRGVLTRKPEWQNMLAGFQIESAWMMGAWDDVENLVERSTTQTAQIATGRVLLAMRNRDSSAISTALVNARTTLGSPITAAGSRSYRRSYDAVLDLHLVHELEVMYQTISRLTESSETHSQQRKTIINELTRTLDTRLDSISPTFRFKELVLSMRRTAYSFLSAPRHNLTVEIGKTWLASAKIARKAGQWQTGYSAMLQAQQSKAQFSFIESAKLIKATNEPLRALKELENSMKLAGILDSNVLDLTDDEESMRIRSKAQFLRTRWMYESQRYDSNTIYKLFQLVTEMDKNSENAHFYLGQFHDEMYKDLSLAESRTRGIKMNLATIRAFTRAVKLGSKYLYQAVPRLLTLWLDLGGNSNIQKEYHEVVSKCHEQARKAIREIPAYKWYIAFPQIVSRVGHPDQETFTILSKLISKVLEEYPKQALWLFTSVVKSNKSNREQRGRSILDALRNNPRLARTNVPTLVQQSVTMTNELLALCDHPIDDDKKVLHMRKDFPRLAQIGRCDLIIPLQESLTATLPPASAAQSTHQPFPTDLPMFQEFFDEIDVMRSLAKPRKISIRGTDGQTYMFLGKPKDDLRKDARLMEFNSIINKLLKANTESRKRQLHIRTYGVITLNEECGFIQWVPNTMPVRNVFLKNYEGRGIRSWNTEMAEIFRKIKEADDHAAAGLFIKDILPKFPPVFHEWFLETFPEPSAWLASRMTYGRTAAVMSMVGFILGLGDRHCENILLDNNTGDVVHVDFNCLFEKGKTLDTPERVPFRLTQNLVDGLGVTGVEGFFRIGCEVTLQLLRDNKDSLMNVLDSFIHDPLVEWEDEKRRLDRQRKEQKTTIDSLAKTALLKIERKLKGLYAPDTSKDRSGSLKEVSTSNLVQVLIQEATDDANLAKMYPGWAAWH